MAVRGRWTQALAAVAGVGLAVALSGCDSSGAKTSAAVASSVPSLSSSASAAPSVSSASSSAGQVAVTFTFASSASTAPDLLNRELSIIKARIASENLSGTTVSVSRDGRGFVVQGPAADKDQLQMLGRAGVLGFRQVLAAAAPESAGEPAPSGVPAGLWRKFQALNCTSTPPTRDEPPTAQIVACQNDGSQKFALDAAAVNGTSVTSASASAGLNGSWQVNVSLNNEGATQFAQLTMRLAGTGAAVAITVDGIVYSAPTIQSAITGGELQISGSFNQATAQSLAAILLTGALPEPLTVDSVTG